GSGRYAAFDTNTPAGDRELRDSSHPLWAQALLAYTMTNSGQSFYVSLIAGGSINAERFSTYRLGALLPLVSEFPLSLPGYYYQEISAREYVLFGFNYQVPLDSQQRWNLNATAATAAIDYLHGTEQPGHWHSGVGGGELYKTPSWKFMVGYAYGDDAIRTGGRGRQRVGEVMLLDKRKAKA